MKVIYKTQVKSTNEAARRLLFNESDSYWIVSDEQTQGKGKYYRNYCSPNNGNFYGTYTLLNQKGIQDIAILSIKVSVCIKKIIYSFFGKKVEVKWVNDILYNQKKVGGVLINIVPTYNQSYAIIIGIGLDLVSFTFDNIKFNGLFDRTNLQLKCN